MLTSKQQKWIDHLSDSDKVIIKPFDPTTAEKYNKIKKIIQSNLGKSINVLHCGATSMQISGQDEIDVYIPVDVKKFDEIFILLKNLFGKPRSHYPLERARFVVKIDNKHIDIFLINQVSVGWIDGLRFEKYLKSNPKSLNKYRLLKESLNGVSTREYYKNKIEFINKILEKC